MLEKLLRWFSPKLSEVSPIEESALRFEKCLNTELDLYRDIREIEVLYPNIVDYTKELERFLERLKDHRHYTPTEAKVSIVKRRNFYTDTNGYFVKIDEYHVRFIQNAINALRHYEEAELDDKKDGLMQSSLYHALPMINNLIALSQTLEVLSS